MAVVAPYSIEDLQRRLGPVLSRAGALRAWVFGSHARAEADEDSDVDVAVVAETELPFVERYSRFAEAFDEVPELEMWVYTPGEWDAMRAAESPFYLGITESYVPLLVPEQSNDSTARQT